MSATTADTKPAKPAAGTTKAAAGSPFRTYIHRLVHVKKQEVSRKAVDVLSAVFDDLLARIVRESRSVLLYSQRRTLSARDVAAAVQLVVGTGELGKFANAEAKSCIARFQGPLRTPHAPGKPAPNVTKTTRAGLVISVARAEAALRAELGTSSRVSKNAAVALAAVLEYCLVELINGVVNAALAAAHTRLTPADIKLALAKDEEFCVLFRNVVVPGGHLVLDGLIDAPLLAAASARVDKQLAKKKAVAAAS